MCSQMRLGKPPGVLDIISSTGGNFEIISCVFSSITSFIEIEVALISSLFSICSTSSFKFISFSSFGVESTTFNS